MAAKTLAAHWYPNELPLSGSKSPCCPVAVERHAAAQLQQGLRGLRPHVARAILLRYKDLITWTRSKVPTHLFSPPSYASFATEWNQLASRQHLQVAVHTDGVTVFSQWPLQHFFDYIFSFDSIVSNLQYPRECQGELWIIVRGDGLPCGGESWFQMSIFICQPWSIGKDVVLPLDC